MNINGIEYVEANRYKQALKLAADHYNEIIRLTKLLDNANVGPPASQAQPAVPARKIVWHEYKREGDANGNIYHSLDGSQACKYRDANPNFSRFTEGGEA